MFVLNSALVLSVSNASFVDSARNVGTSTGSSFGPRITVNPAGICFEPSGCTLLSFCIFPMFCAFLMKFKKKNEIRLR